MAFFQHYRYSTIGMELDDVISELMDEGSMDQDQANMVQLEFDKAMAKALSTMLNNKATMKGTLHHYRNCDGIWTFVVKNATFRIDASAQDERVDEKIKITACDSKLSALRR
eukprot:Plantae.Rhodophyta-Rhodochaete_pulchella.ctg2075.p2 GENE.Plantae.Rhodophyta-Rhodochaete_pulchella.ctg2075~~Plantae.Rhodophyta-Rhodochaete_pulchella.ctg2075.p2  ORF type:complete len:112 (+),score=31.42 Plantae.Rhodophyta-Rhodochaete_pulchella.ctg2075:683-1018(+)